MEDIFTDKQTRIRCMTCQQYIIQKVMVNLHEERSKFVTYTERNPGGRFYYCYMFNCYMDSILDYNFLKAEWEKALCNKLLEINVKSNSYLRFTSGDDQSLDMN